MKVAAPNATVDLEGIDCTICFAPPLRPPVFQCAAGRLLSLTCYEELLEKDTLVIPKASPSTSINITINCCESKKKICDDKSPMGPVLKMGPCGGGFGDVWEMDVRGVNRIVKLVLWHCGAVDAISVVYELDGREEQTSQWGKPQGEC